MLACVEVPRETAEWLPVDIEVNALPYLTFDTSVTALGARPSVWTAAVMLDGEPGVMIENLTPGTYKVWAKVSTGVQDIVVHVGNVVVT